MNIRVIIRLENRQDAADLAVLLSNAGWRTVEDDLGSPREVIVRLERGEEADQLAGLACSLQNLLPLSPEAEKPY